MQVVALERRRLGGAIALHQRGEVLHQLVFVKEALPMSVDVRGLVGAELGAAQPRLFDNARQVLGRRIVPVLGVGIMPRA